MFYHIVDKDIELNPIGLQYAEELFHLIDENRDYLKQWLPWLDSAKNPDDTKKFIKESLEKDSENNGFVVVIKYRGKIAGEIGLHYIDHANKMTGIGYWLAAGFQGNGVMTKSCKAVVNYCFRDLDLNRVEIRCGVDNYKSRAVPERLNFKKEGIIRQCQWLYDHFVDHVVYGKLKFEQEDLYG